jgi:DNA-binding CsgD family transcriptional regulator
VIVPVPQMRGDARQLVRLSRHAMTRGQRILHESDMSAEFGLTAAEARLALRLLAGESVRDAAHALGITYESARSRLKSIFQKTGTHRQGELIALLARTASRLLLRGLNPHPRGARDDL